MPTWNRVATMVVCLGCAGPESGDRQARAFHIITRPQSPSGALVGVWQKRFLDRYNRGSDTVGARRSLIAATANGSVHLAADAGIGNARWIQIALNGDEIERAIPEVTTAAAIANHQDDVLVQGPAPTGSVTRLVRYTPAGVETGYCGYTKPPATASMSPGSGVAMMPGGWSWMFGNGAIAACGFPEYDHEAPMWYTCPGFVDNEFDGLWGRAWVARRVSVNFQLPSGSLSRAGIEFKRVSTTGQELKVLYPWANGAFGGTSDNPPDLDATDIAVTPAGDAAYMS